MTFCFLVNHKPFSPWLTSWLSRLIQSNEGSNFASSPLAVKVGAASDYGLRRPHLVSPSLILSNPIQGATMIEGLFQPTHLLLIFGIALLVFGPKKLPELGKGIGEGIRGFKSAMKAEEEKPASTTTIVANEQSATKG